MALEMGDKMSLKFVSIFILLLNIHGYVNAQFGTIKKQNHHRDPEGRIIGGHEAVPHSAPYAVAIWTLRNDSNGFSQCTGILISENYVLTAAHCLRGTYFNFLVFGAHNRSDINEAHQDKRVNGSYVIHEHFDRSILLNDIALIKLPSPLVLNEYIQSVKLVSKVNANKSFVGETARIYGWGMLHQNPDKHTNLLRYVDVPVISNSECSDKDTHKSVFEESLCTSGDTIKGACHGDSGGPLILDSQLIGIVSRGTSEYCEHGDPSVFVRIGHYLDWIESHSDVKIN